MKKKFVMAAGTLVLAGSLLFGAPKQPQPKSQKEAEAVMAIMNAQDPDGRIAAAENLITKFADTEFKAVALGIAAFSAQQKGDFEKMVIYAERTLEADPQNYNAMLMLASGIAQKTREHDLDKEEKLKRAEGLANQALQVIDKAEKPRPDISEEQWAAVKKDSVAQAHEALGIAAVVRKKYDVAVNEFKASIDSAAQPDPGTMVRLVSAYNASGKSDEAIAMADKVLATPNLHPQIKAIAESEKANAAKAKAAKKP
jgi:tetratricopeptide (TPR) repeat protein